MDRTLCPECKRIIIGKDGGKYRDSYFDSSIKAHGLCEDCYALALIGKLINRLILEKKLEPNDETVCDMSFVMDYIKKEVASKTIKPSSTP